MNLSAARGQNDDEGQLVGGVMRGGGTKTVERQNVEICGYIYVNSLSFELTTK